jgi:hypothetical protein
MRHEYIVNSAQFSPNGEQVVTASSDNTARLWDVLDGTPIGMSMKHDGAVYSAQFSPDGQRVVTTSEHMSAWLWDTLTGRGIGVLSGFIAGTQSGLTASSDYTAGFPSAPTSRFAAQLSAHRLNELSQSLTGEQQARAEILANTREQLAQIEQMVASVNSQQQSIMAKANEAMVQSWKKILYHKSGAPNALFSADGRRVVTAFEDNTAWLRDVPQTSSKDNPKGVLLLAELAEATGGVRLQASVLTEIRNVLTPKKVREMREKIAANFTAPFSDLTPLQRLLKWSVLDRKSRTISPFSELTVAEWLENKIDEGTIDGLRSAIQVAPANARLAASFGRRLADDVGKEKDPREAGRARAEADFQTRRGLRLAPDNYEVRKLRAEVVRMLQLGSE